MSSDNSWNFHQTTPAHIQRRASTAERRQHGGYSETILQTDATGIQTRWRRRQTSAPLQQQQNNNTVESVSELQKLSLSFILCPQSIPDHVYQQRELLLQYCEKEWHEAMRLVKEIKN